MSGATAAGAAAGAAAEKTQGAAPQTPFQMIGSGVRSVVNVLNVLGTIIEAADEERDLRVARAQERRTKAARGPIDDVLEQAGIDIPSVETILARALGNTPEARKTAAQIINSGDMAKLFQDFYTKYGNAAASDDGATQARPAPPSSAEAPTATDTENDPAPPTTQGAAPAQPTAAPAKPTAAPSKPTAAPTGPTAAPTGPILAPNQPHYGQVFHPTGQVHAAPLHGAQVHAAQPVYAVQPGQVYAVHGGQVYAVHPGPIHPQSFAMAPMPHAANGRPGAVPLWRAGDPLPPTTDRAGVVPVWRPGDPLTPPGSRPTPPAPPPISSPAPSMATRRGWIDFDDLPTRPRPAQASAAKAPAAPFKAPSPTPNTALAEELREFIVWTKDKVTAIEARLDANDKRVSELREEIGRLTRAIEGIKARKAARAAKAAEPAEVAKVETVPDEVAGGGSEPAPAEADDAVTAEESQPDDAVMTEESQADADADADAVTAEESLADDADSRDADPDAADDDTDDADSRDDADTTLTEQSDDDAGDPVIEGSDEDDNEASTDTSTTAEPPEDPAIPTPLFLEMKSHTYAALTRLQARIEGEISPVVAMLEGEVGTLRSALNQLQQEEVEMEEESCPM